MLPIGEIEQHSKCYGRQAVGPEALCQVGPPQMLELEEDTSSHRSAGHALLHTEQPAAGCSVVRFILTQTKRILAK